MKPKARILIAAGLHGEEDGSLGEADDRFVESSIRMVVKMVEDNKDEFEKNNIKMFVEDIADPEKNGALDPELLVKAIVACDPTFIILAICYSSVSVINDIFCSAGIYAALVMKEDRGVITERRCVIMDEDQEKIIQFVAQKNPKNIFLWGSSGTGKTLLLSQALTMKMSKYKRDGINNIKVIVSNWRAVGDQFQLMQDFKKKYLSHLVALEQVTFISGDQLCEELNINSGDRLAHPQDTMKALLAAGYNESPIGRSGRKQ